MLPVDAIGYVSAIFRSGLDGHLNKVVTGVGVEGQNSMSRKAKGRCQRRQSRLVKTKHERITEELKKDQKNILP